MVKEYKNPPLNEALCELKFVVEQPWDWTIPGLVFSRISKEYPVKKEIKRVGMEFKSIRSDFESKVIQGTERLQFINEKNNRLIQVGENLLTINQLRPYNSWSEFKSRILEAIKVYQDIVKPIGIRSLGLRYINRIPIDSNCKIEDYFNYYPKFPDDDQEIIDSLHMKSTIPIPNMKEMEGAMNMIFAIEPIIRDKEEPIWTLDLDMMYRWKSEEPLPFNKVEDTIERAHIHVEKVFESCITDELRGKFN